MKPNVEIDPTPPLRLNNEMWERGFKFGKLDLYRSQATEFLIDGDTLSAICRDGWSRENAKQIVRAREEENSF